MEYYERIRILRENQDLSQKKLGDLLNLNQRTVSQYERNGRSLPIDVVISVYFTRRVCTFIYISSKKTLFISYGRNEPKTTKGGVAIPPFETPNRLKGSPPLRIPRKTAF